MDSDDGGDARPTRRFAASPPSRGSRAVESRATARPSRGFAQTFSSLRIRSYLFLWLGMMAMMASVQMQMVARGYLAYDINELRGVCWVWYPRGRRCRFWVSRSSAGRWRDRVERKRVIQITQGVNGAIALTVGVAIFTDRIEWYYLLAASVFQGGIWAFLMPARQALIPQLVGPEQLSNAIALNAAGMSAMTLLSPALAGGLYALAGPDTVYFVIAALSAVALVLTTMVPRGGGRPRRQASRHGLRYLGRPLVHTREPHRATSPDRWTGHDASGHACALS